MSICERLRSGQSICDAVGSARNYQQVVLMNRRDIRNKRVERSFLTIGGEYVCRYGVYFDLVEGATGYAFKLHENASSIFGSTKSDYVDDIMNYEHSVSMVVYGIDEASKCLRSQLDSGDLFAAVQYYDGTIEIYGIEYGLKPKGYTYEPHVTRGFTAITLTSDGDALEDDLPLIYKSQGDANEDFENLFANHTFEVNGDFNDDFNNDFNNQQ